MSEPEKPTWENFQRVIIEREDLRFQAVLVWQDSQGDNHVVKLRASHNFEKAWHSISEEALDMLLDESEEAR